MVRESYYVEPTSAQGVAAATLATNDASIEAAFTYAFNRAGQLYLTEYPEEVANPMGTGARKIRRDYDHLNRVTAIYDDGDVPGAGQFIATYAYIGGYRIGLQEPNEE